MTKLYLIRHGESEANRRRLFAGQSNFDLTETGHRQAAGAASFFKDIRVDKIIASDLLRAYHTAVPLSEERGLVIEKNENFREIFAGKWEGAAFDEIEEKYPVDYGVWRTDIGCACCTGGESVCHLGERVLAAITKAAIENDGKNVVIATHATPIRALLSLWQAGDVAAMKDIPWVPNASVTSVTYENGAFTVDRIGETDHLAGLLTKLPANV